MRATNFDGRKFQPLIDGDRYRVVLAPSLQYQGTRRSEAFPRLGISYLYGISAPGVSGAQTEVVEVLFDRADWTASQVIDWMEKNGDALPRPSQVKPVPPGRPALDAPGAEAAGDPPCRKKGESTEDCMKRKIPKMIREGMPQDQAVAAARSMCSKSCGG